MDSRYTIMGIVNVTPDSFSDGGLYLDADRAVQHARELVTQGADVLDIGGESTRPGARPVSAAEELGRVLPVIEALCDGGGPPAPISIDTSKAAVAHAALDAGATEVNDVTALRGDPEMADLIAQRGVRCCLMHMRGEPRTMQRDPRYGDVVDDVRAFLEQRLRHAVARGVRERDILLDPGIGFGKTAAHNLALLRRLPEIAAIGRPVAVGVSRKTFLGEITGRPVGERLAATVAASALALERGASVFRVHDVAPVRDALAVAAATVGEPWSGTATSTRD